MSARNRPAAKAARRAERQDRHCGEVAPGISKARVAEAVHEAVCLAGRDDGIGHCDAYAFGGAIVLSVLTRQDWLPQGGAAQFGTGVDRDSPDGELCFSWMPSATTPVVTPNGMTGEGGLANGELHAWCARAQDGNAAEIADFSIRHIPRLARWSGMGWEREEPPYAWGTPGQLHGQRFWYQADRDTTNFIHEMFKANTHSYSDIATLALWRLGKHSDRRAQELMHDPKLLGLMRDGYKITQSFEGGFIAVRG